MSTTIPDLWSSDIRVDVLSPWAILRSQESLLERKTQGLLAAKVNSSANAGWVEHQLNLVAPALENYRVTLLAVRHRQDSVYPVEVRSWIFVPKEHQPDSPIIRALAGIPPADRKDAATQEEFINLVRDVLQSPGVRSLMQSLIARSNELRLSEKPLGHSGVDSASPLSESSEDATES